MTFQADANEEAEMIIRAIMQASTLERNITSILGTKVK